MAYFEGVVAQQLGLAEDARTAFRRFLSLVPSRFTDQIAEVRGRLRAHHGPSSAPSPGSHDDSHRPPPRGLPMNALWRRGLAVGGLATALLARPVRAQSSYDQLQAFSAVLNFVRLNYADSVAYPEMVRAAIEGVLRSLDPHSYFLARADYE